MADLLRKVAGVRLGIAIQVFTTLLILAVGYFAVERNLQELVLINKPISPFQLKMALLEIRTQVLIVAFVAFLSGLVLAITIRREVKRAVQDVRAISQGVVEPYSSRDLSHEFVPLSSAIRELGDSLGRFFEQSVTDAIVLVREDLTIETLNPNAEVLFGYRSEDVRGKPLRTLLPEDRSNEVVYCWLREAGAGPPASTPRTGSIVNQKGEWITVRLGAFQIQREGHPLRGIVAGVFDEREWGRIREEFERADRLSSLGLLVGGLAHEIKNPLGSIQGLVQMLAEDFAPDDPRGRYCETILEEVRRLDEQMKRLLDLASPSQWKNEEVLLTRVLEEVSSLVQGEARRRGVTVGGDRPERDWRLSGDPDRIRQAIVNVMKNAIEATPQGGEVHWRLGKEDSWVVLSVVNPGASFPESVASRMPSPLVSTKMEGTGLGLAITHQILHHHGGKIEVQNPINGGAVVRLLFPVTRNREAEDQPHGTVLRSPASPPIRGVGR
jgi:PAS domain S-box-containing protein